MSTRATYEFKGGEYQPDVTIYVHHDGYLAGAATYFYQAFVAGKSAWKLTAESFIRGNERAEITQSHEAHGDTEYRYTLDADGKTLKAQARVNFTDEWKLVYLGDWVDFVNEHAVGAWIEGGVEKLARVKIVYGEQVHSKSTLTKAIEEKLQLLGLWLTGCYASSPDAANVVSVKNEVAALRAGLAALEAAERVAA